MPVHPCRDCELENAEQGELCHTVKDYDKTTDNMIVAYSCNDHLLLDLDHTTFTKVCGLAKLITGEYKELGGYMILESTPPKSSEVSIYHPIRRKPQQVRSLGGYHLVFGHKLKWTRIMEILKVLTGLNIYTRQHMKIRKFRRDLTLRISPKNTQNGNKSSPKYFIQHLHCTECSTFFDYYLMLLDKMNKR